VSIGFGVPRVGAPTRPRSPLPFTPTELGAYMAEEAGKWAKVVRAANVRIE
jgi:hypothetical protein